MVVGIDIESEFELLMSDSLESEALIYEELVMFVSELELEVKSSKSLLELLNVLVLLFQRPIPLIPPAR